MNADKKRFEGVKAEPAANSGPKRKGSGPTLPF
jgi:hypothetical protein